MSNLKIQGNASGAGTTTLQSGNTSNSVTFSLPIADGTSGQALITDGSGVMSFATVGTDASSITSGTLAVARGGTGVTTSTGSGNNVLSTSPTLVTPILGTPTSGTATNLTGLPLTTGVTGTLPVANGGTGATSLTANNVILGNGTSAVQVVAPSTAGNVLTSNGTTWTSSTPGASITAGKVIALSTIFGY